MMIDDHPCYPFNLTRRANEDRKPSSPSSRSCISRISDRPKHRPHPQSAHPTHRPSRTTPPRPSSTLLDHPKLSRSSYTEFRDRPGGSRRVEEGGIREGPFVGGALCEYGSSQAEHSVQQTQFDAMTIRMPSSAIDLSTSTRLVLVVLLILLVRPVLPILVVPVLVVLLILLVLPVLPVLVILLILLSSADFSMGSHSLPLQKPQTSMLNGATTKRRKAKTTKPATALVSPR